MAPGASWLHEKEPNAAVSEVPPPQALEQDWCSLSLGLTLHGLTVL